MKMFVKKYKWYIVWFAIILLIGVYNINRSRTEYLTDSQFVDVKAWSISSSLQALWTVKIVNNQKLTFGVNGRVTHLYVKQWDIATKGQVLAEIDTSDILNDIEQQKLQVSNAVINYNKLFSNTKEYQIKQAQADAERLIFASSMWDIELQQLNLEKQEMISAQENSIKAIKDRLSLNRLKIDTIKGDIKYTTLAEWQTLNAAEADNNAVLQTIKNTMSTSVLDAKDLITNVKQMMYFDTTEKYPLELWARDFSVRQKAENTYNIFKKTLSDLENVSTQIPTDYASAKTILDKNKELLQGSMELTDDVFAVLDASIDGTELPQSQIDIQKSTIMSLKSKFNLNLNNLTNLDKQLATALDPEITKLNTQNIISQKEQNLQDLQNTIDNDTRSLKEAEDKLNKLHLDYDIKIQNKQNDIVLQSKNAEVARLSAISLATGPTPDEKAWASNMISQAKVWLTKTSDKLKDYQIIALFDGKVSAIDFHIDDQISSYMEGITIESSWSYEINVLMDQLDVVKMHPWQGATISFDAYPDMTFYGYVSAIDPTPVEDQWIVSYKATILLDNIEEAIYNKMSATVSIEIDKKNDVLLIPSLALISSWYDNFVELYNGNKISMHKVEVWINNGKNIEIVSWVSLWQKVVVRNFGVTNPTSSSPFGPPQSQEDNPRIQMDEMDNGWSR